MGLPPSSRDLFHVALIDNMSGTNLFITGRPGGTEDVKQNRSNK